MSKADIEVAAAVDKLFRRLPALMGFSVQQVLEHELVALLDLVDEEPAARDLLIGRTFARKLH